LSHVAVIALTYRRPAGLKKLLDSLARQRAGAEPFKLTAIIIDNDAAGSGEAVARSYPARDDFAVHYQIEQTQGIPYARNAGLDAVPADCEFLCFIDDDEFAPDDWLANLLATQRATGAECVHGAVIPVYPDNAPQWLVRSKVFDSWNYPDRAPLKAAASNNVMISTAFVRRSGLRFEERMRMTGGTDYLYFKQAVRQGLTIVWSAGAPVYEDIPRSRMTLRWLAQRQYRLGNTFTVSERIDGTRLGLLRWAAIGVARVGLGIVLLPAFLFSPRYAMRSVVHLLRGLGILAGASGHSHQEYAPASLAKDRTQAANSANGAG
jgi:glycosyltransferase involved in cell wall biosynthesis